MISLEIYADTIESSDMKKYYFVSVPGGEEQGSSLWMASVLVLCRINIKKR